MFSCGFSFHNIQAFFSITGKDNKNEEFQEWLIDTIQSTTITENQRMEQLAQWKQAPYARYAHPRSEHFIPLFVCYGINKTAGKIIFDDEVLGERAIGVLWES